MAPKMKAAMKATMKAMKATKKAMTKTGLAEALASETELSKKDCAAVIESLATICAAEVKKTGKLTIPGLVMVKTRKKPATKAGKREMFGKVVLVKAQPAKTVVKAYPVKALKDNF